MRKLKARLARKFEIKDLGTNRYILGMDIHRGKVNTKLRLIQMGYIKIIL